MNDVHVFETTRLYATDWSVDYAESALEIYGDPEVTRFIGGNTFETAEILKEQIELILKKYEGLPDGMGSFPVFLKSTGSMVGTALIKPIPTNGDELSEDIEIGWHLAKRQWGRGYATEYGKKILEIAFEEMNLDLVHAIIDPPNEKSKSVALRLGMKFTETTEQYYDGKTVEHYVLTREDYLNNRSS